MNGVAQDTRKRVVTPEAIISFPRLFKPEPGPQGGEPKYSAAFIFVQGTDLTQLKQAIVVAGQEKWGDKFAELVRAKVNFRLPFRNDVAGKGYPEGSTFFNATSKQRPQIVDANLQEVNDPEKVYAGAKVLASVTAFAYDNVGRGVAFALNNVQFLADGERLDNRLAAADEFDKMMSEVPADLADLM